MSHDYKQKAQLSQTGCATLRVTEYFAYSHSKPFEMTPLSRACLYCNYLFTVSDTLTTNNGAILNSGLEVTRGHRKWYHPKAWGTVSYSPFIVTTAVSCAVSPQYTNMTDRHTATARRHSLRWCTASRGKNKAFSALVADFDISYKLMYLFPAMS